MKKERERERERESKGLSVFFKFILLDTTNVIYPINLQIIYSVSLYSCEIWSFSNQRLTL
jgi:hypothetical protein